MGNKDVSSSVWQMASAGQAWRIIPRTKCVLPGELDREGEFVMTDDDSRNSVACLWTARWVKRKGYDQAALQFKHSLKMHAPALSALNVNSKSTCHVSSQGLSIKSPAKGFVIGQSLQTTTSTEPLKNEWCSVTYSMQWVTLTDLRYIFTLTPAWS